MKKLNRHVEVLVLFMLVFLSMNCSKKDENEIPENLVPTGRSKVYQMFSTTKSDISGTATFSENEGGFITLVFDLENTIPGTSHPAYLRRFTAAEGGGLALSLGTVDGNTGKGSITFFKLDNGSQISFDELIQFNGYINIVLSQENQSEDICQGDIGVNELTGNSEIYDLSNEAEEVIGTVSFNERVNQTTLLIVGLENNPDAGDYPSHIHQNNPPSGGIAITLNPVSGSDGFGQSQISNLNDDTPITYSELLTFDGYVDVHDSDGNGQVIASGEIVQQ